MKTLGLPKNDMQDIKRKLQSLCYLCKAPIVGNVGDGWFEATEKSDYIQAIGLSSAKFQHLFRKGLMAQDYFYTWVSNGSSTVHGRSYYGR